MGFGEDHYHEFSRKASGAIPVGGNRYVHFHESVTTVNDGRRHGFRAQL